MNKNSTRLYAGADAGHYTLPEQLVTYRNAVQRIDAMPPPVEPQPAAQVREQLLAESVDAFLDGKPLTSVGETIAAAEMSYGNWLHDLNFQAEVFRWVREAEKLALIEYAEVVIRDHLAPATTEVAADLASVAKVLPADANPASLLQAGPKAREAWARLEQIASRYTEIRAARTVLSQRTQVAWDVHGEFPELRNLREFWPGFGRQALSSTSSAPWPMDSQSTRLLWLAHRGAQFICPTVTEQDAIYRETYKDGIEQMEQRAWAAEGFRAIGGGGHT